MICFDPLNINYELEAFQIIRCLISGLIILIKVILILTTQMAVGNHGPEEGAGDVPEDFETTCLPHKWCR